MTIRQQFKKADPLKQQLSSSQHFMHEASLQMRALSPYPWSLQRGVMSLCRVSHTICDPSMECFSCGMAFKMSM